MLRAHLVSEEMLQRKGFYQILSESGAHVILGNYSDYGSSARSTKFSYIAKMINMDCGDNQRLEMLHLNIVENSDLTRATLRAVDTMACISLLDEVYGLVIPVDYATMEANRGEYMLDLAEDLALLLKNDVSMLKHCAFIFNNVPLGVNLAELLDFKQHQAQQDYQELAEQVEEMRASDLPGSNLECISMEKEKNYQNFLVRIYQQCQENLLRMDKDKPGLLKHLNNLPSVAKANLAVEDFCRHKFPKVNFDLVRQVQSSIADSCTPEQRTLSSMQRKIESLEQEVKELKQELSVKKTFTPGFYAK